MCQKIKNFEIENGKATRVPIILIIGEENEEIQRRAIAAGADFVLAKPLTVADVKKVVDRYVFY